MPPSDVERQIICPWRQIICQTFLLRQIICHTHFLVQVYRPLPLSTLSLHNRHFRISVVQASTLTEIDFQPTHLWEGCCDGVLGLTPTLFNHFQPTHHWEGCCDLNWLSDGHRNAVSFNPPITGRAVATSGGLLAHNLGMNLSTHPSLGGLLRLQILLDLLEIYSDLSTHPSLGGLLRQRKSPSVWLFPWLFQPTHLWEGCCDTGRSGLYRVQ